jgi:methylase of polypeptide subunit release factors
MKININLEITILRQLQLLDLYLPENVFKPSFMTREICKSLNLIEDEEFVNSNILDLGTGPGTIACALYHIGCENIYVSELLEDTLDIAKINFERYDFKPKQIYISDIFNNIQKHQKFDLIITNPPAYPSSQSLSINDGLDVSIFSGKDGREFIKRFFLEVKTYLSDRGRFIISIPSFLDWDYVADLLRQNEISYTENISNKCVLPTYGYPKKTFVKNFTKVFNSDYYMDENENWKHHWLNLDNNIAYRVKTIIGRKFNNE